MSEEERAAIQRAVVNDITTKTMAAGYFDAGTADAVDLVRELLKPRSAYGQNLPATLRPEVRRQLLENLAGVLDAQPPKLPQTIRGWGDGTGSA